MTLRLSDVASTPLPPGTKGLPLDGSIRRIDDLRGRRLNLLRGDLPVPVALLKRSALNANLAAMGEFISRAGVKLAPHAKTTMCPQLFERQLTHGAWGLTVATMTQFKLCHDLGAPCLILANELVGEAEIGGLAQLWAQAPERDYYVLVDDIAQAQAISAGFSRHPAAPPARLLIEVGMRDGRCGVRTLGEGVALARAIQALPRAELHGVEGFEGLIASADARQDADTVLGYLHTLATLLETLVAESLFESPEQIIASVGGSAYYDLVTRVIARGLRGVIPVLRSGCYLTHDEGFYERLLARVRERDRDGLAPNLVPALEVWSRVLSRPQPDQAIVLMGKRDVSYDIDLPMARWWFRAGRHAAPARIEGLVVQRLNDQHGWLSVPPGSELAVGDLLGFAISHPCTTFDKWHWMPIVDDDYQVVDAITTHF